MTFYKWSKVAATNANADSTINWQEGQAPSSVNDSSRAEMAANAKWRDDISGTLTTTGSSTAFALTTNQSFSTAALMSGAMITFIPHTNSGASPTLAVDGLTARAINKSTGVAVATGALIAGTPYCVTYIHASTEFLIQNYTEVMGSPTFTGNLTVNGTSTLTGAVTASAAIKAADGTVLLPEYTFTNDLDCGLYRIGANDIGMAINAAKVQEWTTAGTQVTGAITASTSITAGNGLTVSAGAVAVPAGSVADAALVTSPGRTLLATLTASNSATLSDTTSMTSAYHAYELEFENIIPVSSGVICELQVHSAGAFKSTTYVAGAVGADSAGAFGGAISTYIPISRTSSVFLSNIAPGISGTIRVSNPTQTASPKTWTGTFGYTPASNTFTVFTIMGSWNGANGAIDGFQVLMSSGNIASGTVKVYGVT